MKLNDDVLAIKGIGEKNRSLFYNMSIKTVMDLLLHFPRGYASMGAAVPIDKSIVEDVNAVIGEIRRVELLRARGNKTIVNAYVADENERIFICSFFNMPYLKNSLILYKRMVFYGKVTIKADRFYMRQPEIIPLEKYNSMKNELRAFYPLSKGLSNKLITAAVNNALENIDLNLSFTEYLNEETRASYGLMKRADAVYKIHRAKNSSEVDSATRRIIFDEFFGFLYNLNKLKKKKAEPNIKKMKKSDIAQNAIDKLEFRLTKAQMNTFDDIKNDLAGDFVMNRLIQGDVGSGKTIVAILSILLAYENGYQSAFMAPTEVLATQHYEYFLELIEKNKLDMKIALVTGSTKKPEKKKINEGLLTGEISLAIGTHALIEDSVEFKNLALVITDEQHRFGVNQRLKLSTKNTAAHTLVMSATPIPRTLAIILYGELDISIINELPKNRLPIKNAVIYEEHRKSAYQLIIKEARMGHQAYIICPMVHENDELNLKNVVQYTEKLKQIFPNDVRIQSIHGQLSSKEKARLMDDFKNQRIDVLISTTVIEVGVNVPNATVIMIEDSDRFGLSQLHQLRGRVGRGANQSYAMFMTNNRSKKVADRLNVLKSSNDGFYIANEDLKLRGPGEIFGIRQSGSLSFRLADIYENADLLKLAGSLVSRALADNKNISLLDTIFKDIDEAVI